MVRSGHREPRRVLVETDAPSSDWRRPPSGPGLLERHPALDRTLGVLAGLGRWTGRVVWAVVQAVLPG